MPIDKPALHFLRRLAAALALCVVATTALAGAGETDFTFKDWEVACDNTRHCEAAGFQAEDDGEGNAVALWIARDAGPGTAVTARLSVQAEAPIPDTTLLQLSIGAGPALHAHNAKTFDAGAFLALPHVLEAASADVTAGKQHFTLSLNGMKAALLKMDDLQGRIGTPGALLRKGTRAEAGVLPALPAPRLHGMPLPANPPADAALLRALLKSTPKGLASHCDDPAQHSPGEDDTQLQRVSATQVALVHSCNEGYNSATDVWIATDKPPYAVQPAPFAAPHAGTGEGADTNDAYFDNGLLKTEFKGRGLNDCASRQTWLWTGQRFEMAEATEAGLCRGFSSDDVHVRTWTTVR